MCSENECFCSNKVCVYLKVLFSFTLNPKVYVEIAAKASFGKLVMHVKLYFLQKMLRWKDTGSPCFKDYEYDYRIEPCDMINNQWENFDL